ncbi:MAG: hypothetical protein AAGG65_07430 [Pseudomonadota bacterium]
MIQATDTHGPFDVVRIENETVRVAVVPDYGAKIIELTDKRSGRNWLVTGTPTEAAGGDAVFGGPQAYGWDECFPTVAPWAGASWPPATRDHGALWGRPWCVESEDDVVTTTFDHADFIFSRRLVLDEDGVKATYTLENPGDRDLAYLWSAHPLLALRPGERIGLPGVDKASATYAKACGKVASLSAMDWPTANINDQSIDLSHVHAMESGFAAKLYCDAALPSDVTVEGADGRLVLTWQRDLIGALGIWLDYGGWPDEEPVHQVAFEPTTAPADDLLSAQALGRHTVLSPGEQHTWWLAFALEAAA